MGFYRFPEVTVAPRSAVSQSVKVMGEANEAFEAACEYSRHQSPADRAHAIEEGMDVIQATETYLRTLGVTEDELTAAMVGVIAKNERRNYYVH